MAGHHDALWAKLHELELQLAAYKLLRAPRGEDTHGEGRALWPPEATCRGRQYDAYMRRRDARLPRTPGGGKPMSPRALRCTARDAQEVKKTPAVSIPSSTPRRETTAALPRSRTVSGATGNPARQQHQRRSNLSAPADFGDGAATPRPFLRRGRGTGGAAAPARLRAPPRVHDHFPSIDVPLTPRHPQMSERAHAARHARSVSELPFDTAAALASPTTPARARRRWGSPERPAAMVPATTDSHRDFSKGLKKLLSFARKGGKGQGGDADQPCPTGGKSGKPVMSKGWSGRAAVCSLLEVPFDRASLDGHRFPMTRTVGISG